MKIKPPESTSKPQSEHKSHKHGKFLGGLTTIIESVKSIYTHFIPHDKKGNHIISTRLVSIPNPPEHSAPWVFKANKLQLKTIAELMSSRASIAGMDLLDSIISSSSPSETYIACNGKDGEESRFAIISIHDSPPHEKTTIEETQSDIAQHNETMSIPIEDCLWVEFLVADSGSGLGNKLIKEVESIAIEKGKKGLALSAYEFDPKDDDENSTIHPYSIANYYTKKHGFIYSGHAHEELEQNEDGTTNSSFYPIYLKPLINIDNIDKTD